MTTNGGQTIHERSLHQYHHTIVGGLLQHLQSFQGGRGIIQGPHYRNRWMWSLHMEVRIEDTRTTTPRTRIFEIKLFVGIENLNIQWEWGITAGACTLTQHRQVSKDCQFEWDKIIRVHLCSLGMRNLVNDRLEWTHPVFCCLPNKRTLITTSTRITYHRIASCAHKVIQFRQLDD